LKRLGTGVSSKNRFILLVGNKGAGKSTLIDRFFKFVLSAEIAKDWFCFVSISLLIRVMSAASFSGLNQRLLEECERAVFTSDAPGWDECVGKMFFDHYQRWLELTKDAIASPHLRLDDLLKVHLAGTPEVVPEYRIKQAIIKRRYDIYPVGEHSFVQNLFALNLDPPTTPLIGARILQFLRDAGHASEKQEQEFVFVNSVYEHFHCARNSSSGHQLVAHRSTEDWIDTQL
jgi:hypothetical protein